MENTEKIKAELQALNEAHRQPAKQTWVEQERKMVGTETPVDVVSVELEPFTVPIALFYPDDPASQGAKALLLDAHDSMTKLTDALSRVLKLVDELEQGAQKHERVAYQCRLAGRYAVSKVHLDSATRMRATQRAFCVELTEAFGLDADNTQEDEHNGNS